MAGRDADKVGVGGALRDTDGDPSDLHALEPEDFLAEVHSFEHWFGAVEDYLSGLDHGHRTDILGDRLEADERERLIGMLCNYTVAETTALDASSGLVRIAPNRQAKVFLSTQVVDEGRHVEVMLHRMRELGVPDPEAEVARRAGPSIRHFRAKLLELVDARDWEAAIFTQNVVLEALEASVFSAHARTADPVTRDLLERVLRDERRHIGFGENEIGRCMRADSRLGSRLAELKTLLDRLVLETLEETQNELRIPRDDRPALVRDYLQSVERLGIR